MFKGTLIFGSIFCLWPYIAKAEISSRVMDAIFVMQSACLARSELSIEAKGEGNVLILKKGAKVEGEYKETEIKSLLSKLQSEVNLMGEADKIRACMSPHIGRILDAVLGSQTEAVPSPQTKEAMALQYIRINAQRSFIESHAGPAQHEEKSKIFRRCSYSFNLYYMQILYDKDNKIVQYSITSRSDKFKPKIPGWPGGELCLGCFKFPDVIEDRDAKIADYNYSTKDIYYVERVESSEATLNRIFFFSYSALGAEYNKKDDPVGILDALFNVYYEPKKATAKEKAMWKQFRNNTTPNSFAIRSAYMNPTKPTKNEEDLTIPVIDYFSVSRLGF